MKNLRKIFASAMVTAMLATMGVSAFATTGTPHGLENLGEKYGFTVEYAGEIDGDALYKTSRNIDIEALVEQEQGVETRATCNHNWFTYWVGKRKQCIRNPDNMHTEATKLKECLECGKILATGEWKIQNCPSGCKKSDYF